MKYRYNRVLQSCRPKNVFEGTIKRMVLYQCNFRASTGLLTNLIQFPVRAGFGFIFSNLSPVRANLRVQADLVGPFTTLSPLLK